MHESKTNSSSDAGLLFTWPSDQYQSFRCCSWCLWIQLDTLQHINASFIRFSKTSKGSRFTGPLSTNANPSLCLFVFFIFNGGISEKKNKKQKTRVWKFRTRLTHQRKFYTYSDTRLSALEASLPGSAARLLSPDVPSIIFHSSSIPFFFLPYFSLLSQSLRCWLITRQNLKVHFYQMKEQPKGLLIRLDLNIRLYTPQEQQSCMRYQRWFNIAIGNTILGKSLE